MLNIVKYCKYFDMLKLVVPEWKVSSKENFLISIAKYYKYFDMFKLGVPAWKVSSKDCEIL